MADLSDSIKVTVVNAGKHHAFQTAMAAAEAGMLAKFVTSSYYHPNSLPYSLIDRLLPIDNKNLQRLHNQREESVDRYAVSMPWLGLPTNFIVQLPGIHGHSTARGINHFKNYMFDHFVANHYVHGSDVFHGFSGSTAQSFQAAKKQGQTTVLDQHIMHLAELQEMKAREYAKWGVSLPSKSFFYAQDIKRNTTELELADYIFVGLNFVKESLTKRGVPESKITVIPYGVDVSGRFRPVTRPFRKSFTILYVGVLSWIKGLPYLLDAFSKLRLPDAELVVVGREEPGWGNYFREQFAKIPNVRWIQGVPQQQLVRLYEQADILVFPSLVGGIGLVVYEAMATGLPVLTSDGDVVIRNNVDGTVANPRNVDEFQKAILDLYTDRELRLTLGSKAVERAQEFSWQTYRRRIIELYLEITNLS